MDRPYLHELAELQSRSDLYSRWIEHALDLTRDDILYIVRNGLTYQAEALRSMIKEIIAGGATSPKLFKKLDLIVLATRRYAEKIR